MTQLDTAALTGTDTLADQPYQYPPAWEFDEPDWRRIPGYRDVAEDDWLNARWQRQHTIRSADQLRAALGRVAAAG
jgi:lysine 2,3-aminomutase